MSVVGYDCDNCGVVNECTVDDSGQRICVKCEAPVLGITHREAQKRNDVETVRDY